MQLQELDQASQQEYTILQEGPMFDYPATLGTVRRSRGYHDCGWRSHVRIVSPARVYQQETGPVHECVIRDLTRIFREPLSQVKPRLNHGIETNHFTTTVVGSLTYKEGHALCEGRDASMNGERKVMENGASILANLRQGQGINTDFGTLWLR